MRSVRFAVVVVVLLVWGAFIPLTMAIDHYAVMDSTCAGPCAAPAIVTPPVLPMATDLVSHAPVEPVPPAPQLELSSLKPPPKLFARSA